MAIELSDLVDPSHTALVTQEAQRGVIGDRAALPMLADAARESGATDRMGELAAAARAAGVQVVHCVAKRRPDLKGGNTNARLFTAMAKVPDAILEGTDAVEVVPEIGTDPADLVLSRYHGLGPMGGTDLDAVNAGYQFVLPRDAVAGFPPEYAEAVIDNTLALVATVTTTAEIIDVWRKA